MIFPVGPPATTASPLGMECDVCGSPDRLGLGTCVSCAQSGSDALLFLETSTRRADRRVLEAWLVGALEGAVSRSAAREAAEGLRPVVGLPAEAAGRAAGVLTMRGVNAVTVPRTKAWKRVPGAFALLTGATGGVGLFVGLTGTPLMLLLGPAFSALLIFGALRQLQQPVWRPQAGPVLGLSDAVEPTVRATLALLPKGRARQQLKALAALAAALGEPDELPASEELAEASDELVRLACGAVVDLDQLDRSLEILEQQPEDGAADESLQTAVAEATDIRDALFARLEDALGTLVRAQAANTDSAAELLKAAERLAEESIHRSKAWHEVQRLVS